MLQNGTIMNGVMIEKPHRFITACTIATQIILAVTSSTYGGATVSLSHLAPFVKSSYDKYYKKYKENGLTEEQAKKFAEKRGDKSYYVRGTFTAYNLDFANDILYLRDQGFEQISIEPVVLPEDSPMALRQEHLPQIMAEYERLAEEYLQSRATGKWFNLLILSFSSIQTG